MSKKQRAKISRTRFLEHAKSIARPLNEAKTPTATATAAVSPTTTELKLTRYEYIACTQVSRQKGQPEAGGAELALATGASGFSGRPMALDRTFVFVVEHQKFLNRTVVRKRNPVNANRALQRTVTQAPAEDPLIAKLREKSPEELAKILHDLFETKDDN